MQSERLDQLFELRLLIEPYVAGKLAKQATSVVVAELRAIDSMMRQSQHSDTRATYSEFATHDAAFHNCIARRCGNDLLYESLQRLHTHVQLFRLYFLARATTDANLEHADIIQAIADSDAASAEATMTRHLERSRMRFIAAFHT